MLKCSQVEISIVPQLCNRSLQKICIFYMPYLSTILDLCFPEFSFLCSGQLSKIYVDLEMAYFTRFLQDQVSRKFMTYQELFPFSGRGLSFMNASF